MLSAINNVARQSPDRKIRPAQQNEDDAGSSDHNSQHEQQLPEVAHALSVEDGAPRRIIPPMRRSLALRCFPLLLCVAPALAQSAEKPAVVDAGLGPCSLEITVVGPDSKPVYAAKVTVHIAYRFGGFHKLDLEVGTDSEGRAKFTGLPARVRRPPLEFDATKDDLSGTLNYDPATKCVAKEQIALEKGSAAGPAQ